MMSEAAGSYLAALREVFTRRTPKAPFCADLIPAHEIPSVRAHGDSDRVLADLDQDGIAFARDNLDRPVFNTRERFLPRKTSRLQVILSEGRVCLRKQFPLRRGYSAKNMALDRLGLFFLTEVAALKRLQPTGCVPRLIRFDLYRRIIDMDFIVGKNLRHIIGAQHPVLDLDMRQDAALSRLPLAERTEREFALSVAILSEDLRSQVLTTFQRIHALGVVSRDPHLANVIIGRNTGQPYLVDFELASLCRRTQDSRAIECERYLQRKLDLC